MKKPTHQRCFVLLLVVLVWPLLPTVASAVSIPLESNAYATFCQTSFNVSTAVDGSFSTGANGWALSPSLGTNHTAVFKTVTDVQNPGGGSLAFTFHTLHANSSHNLGRYRLSVTNSSRSTFGQGSECGNSNPDGSASWTVLSPSSATSANGQTLTIQGNGSVLASGSNPSTDVVTVTASTSLTNITGFRLEVLTDASLPSSGPGRFSNGNFVLTELELDLDQTAGEPIATFEVSKVFNDGNSSDVEVHISCNTGLPLKASMAINQDDGVTFVVTSFRSGTLDCRVWETDVPAYSVNYLDDCETLGRCTNDETGCRFRDFSGGDAGRCVIENRLQQVSVEVTKVWFDDQFQFYNDLGAQVRWYCNNPATLTNIQIPPIHEVIGLSCSADLCGILNFNGASETQSFQIYPDWQNGTTCRVEEYIFDDSVESDSSDCDNLLLWPGVGAECTIENTRFYEGIPTLSRYGLAVLALLMLAVGLLGFRRLA